MDRELGTLLALFYNSAQKKKKERNMSRHYLSVAEVQRTRLHRFDLFLSGLALR